MICLFLMLLSGCGPTKQQRVDALKTYRQQYVTSHPELDEKTEKNILDGIIADEMSREQVIAVMGGRGGGISKNFSAEGVLECEVFGPLSVCFSNNKATKTCITYEAAFGGLRTARTECSPLPAFIGDSLAEYYKP